MSVADFFGDLILIYRCWIIWEKKYYVIVLPVLSSAAGLSESFSRWRSSIVSFASLLLTLLPLLASCCCGRRTPGYWDN